MRRSCVVTTVVVDGIMLLSSAANYSNVHTSNVTPLRFYVL